MMLQKYEEYLYVLVKFLLHFHLTMSLCTVVPWLLTMRTK